MCRIKRALQHLQRPIAAYANDRNAARTARRCHRANGFRHNSPPKNQKQKLGRCLFQIAARFNAIKLPQNFANPDGECRPNASRKFSPRVNSSRRVRCHTISRHSHAEKHSPHFCSAHSRAAAQRYANYVAESVSPSHFCARCHTISHQSHAEKHSPRSGFIHSRTNKQSRVSLVSASHFSAFSVYFSARYAVRYLLGGTPKVLRNWRLKPDTS